MRRWTTATAGYPDAADPRAVKQESPPTAGFHCLSENLARERQEQE